MNNNNVFLKILNISNSHALELEKIVEKIT